MCRVGIGSERHSEVFAAAETPTRLAFGQPPSPQGGGIRGRDFRASWARQEARDEIAERQRKPPVFLFPLCSTTGVPVLTFVSCCSNLFYECQNQRDTSKYRL